MSIINEALKKTERSLHKNILTEKPGSKKPSLPLLVLLAFLLIVWTAKFIIPPKKNRAVPGPGNTQPAPLPKPPEEIPDDKPALPKIPEPDIQKFILNGIFFSDRDAYALINNRIVKNNSEIDGARIISINEKNVELDHKGKKITVSLLP